MSLDQLEERDLIHMVEERWLGLRVMGEDVDMLVGGQCECVCVCVRVCVCGGASP